MIKFTEYIVEDATISKLSPINEGLLSSLFDFFKGIYDYYKDPTKLSSAIEKATGKVGDKSGNLDPTQVKVDQTVFITMKDAKENTFNLSLCKLADMPNSTALFQIVDTTNPGMIKQLTGSNDPQELANMSCMAILGKSSCVKGKPATMRILKNAVPGGKDYISTSNFTSVVSLDDVKSQMQL